LNAVTLAHQAHAGQMYGDAPYTRHLAHVENVSVATASLTLTLLAAAWLHDAVEDKTSVTLNEINLLLRFECDAWLVEAVTDGEGKNRKERKAESYFRMFCRPEAIPLKLADRIANVESCLIDEVSVSLLEMYRKEHAEFRSKLYEASLRAEVSFMRTRVRGMWAYLDELLAAHTSDTPQE
jgi:(p)ppGpp synthase/HD superfamily hydrolase